MIRFKCIYCGQRILARDDGADKKGKCPKCNHMLVVPKTTKGRPAISPDKEPFPDRPKPRVPEWDKDQHSMTDEQADALIELCKESFGFLIPTYDELSLFLMAVTWILMILIYVANNQLRKWIPFFLAEANNWSVFIPVFVLALMFLAILGLCIYQVFTTREKTDFEKKIMLGFAVLTNILTGVIAGTYVIRNAAVHDWQLVFPIWNIVNGVLLLLMLRFKIIDEECISDREATFVQIILGLTAVLIIFILCNFVFKLYWAITFSICVVYTTSFDRALQSVFPDLTYRGDEQAP